jgi:acetate kinase
MAIVTVNAGSSSLRLAAYAIDPGGGQLATEHHTDVPRDMDEMFSDFVRRNGISKVAAVVHRVVHGGLRLTQPSIIDDPVEAEIRRLVPLAPLHNPRALECIAAARRTFGTSPLQLAVFDTALYAALPARAATYAVPRTLARQHGIRRFGFHGLAHGAMWHAWCREAPDDLAAGGRSISLQLGSGCSITALADGHPIDTSMGFSPLEGLVMARRAGDIDAGLVSFLCRSEGRTIDEIEAMLNDESGLAGLSGESGDMRALLESDSEDARLAIDVYCYRARKYIGSYVAALGSIDVLLFGGGVGENAPEVRARIVEPLGFFGLALDARRNADVIAPAAPVRISAAHSRVPVWVVPVDEAAALADAGRQALADADNHMESS